MSSRETFVNRPALAAGAAALCAIGCLLILAARPALADGLAPVQLATPVPTPVRGSTVQAAPTPSSRANAGHAHPLALSGPLGIGLSDITACNPTPSGAESDCNLTYNYGPVMTTNTLHIVFWDPAGYTYPSGYQALIERYLTDVAHDSGDPTNTNSVSSQYYDLAGGTTNQIQYATTYAGALNDTDKYPAAAAACTALEGSATACLTETQEYNELDSYLNGKSATRGLGDLYLLVMPQDVQTCFDNYSDCGPYGVGQPNANGQTSEYCGYHTAGTGGFGGSQYLLWANITFVDAASCGVGDSGPNDNNADDTINDISHEMNETITDPIPYATGSPPNVYNANNGGWWDANTNNGGEIGDQCNFVYGNSVGTTTSGAYDELINGDPYEVQTLWSNATESCAMNYGAVAPTASFTSSPSSPHAQDTVTFTDTSHDNNRGGSLVDYGWDFGDGVTSSVADPAHTYATAGTYTVTHDVEDSAGLTSTPVTGTVVVLKRPVTLTYTGATSGNFDHVVTLSAALTDNETGNGVGNQSVSFTLGMQSCSATTSSSGAASCSITLTQTPGGYTAAAAFGGDAVYAAAPSSAPFTIEKEATSISYTGPTTAVYHQAFTASAKLTDPIGGAPISGKTVSFTVGTDSCSAVTGSSGVASCSITPDQAAGPYTMTTSFGGDTDWLASAATAPFAITKEATKLTFDGPAQVANGYPATVAGTLEEITGAPIVGRTVTFTLGTGASAQTCTGQTGATGQASCTIADVAQPAAATTIAASDAFAGDADYLPSSSGSSVRLLYYTGRAYGMSYSLAGGAPTVFADTGQVQTSVASSVSKSLVFQSLPFGALAEDATNVTTGLKSSTATATASSLTLAGLLLPTVDASDVSATSTTTCAGSTGAIKIGELTINGVAYGSITAAPDTVIKVGPVVVTLNEQTAITGADHGLIVNALDIQYPGGLRYIESSAESDIGNCS